MQIFFFFFYLGIKDIVRVRDCVIVFSIFFHPPTPQHPVNESCLKKYIQNGQRTQYLLLKKWKMQQKPK